MQSMVPAAPGGDLFVVFNLSPGSAQKRLALAFVIGILSICFLIAFGPLSGVRLARIDAFVPIYTTALFLNDSITAILLFAQFSILRSRPILVIASGYLFAALMLIPWTLVFPGLLAPTGLMGGMQSTSYIYFFQHAGFPLFIIGYALLKDGHPGTRFGRDLAHEEIALSVAFTALIVLAASFVFIGGAAFLPPVTLDSTRLSAIWPLVGAPVALLSVAAIIVLWIRRRSALDLWLMVVMLLFSIEIPLSFYPDPARFSIGWYTVRVIGIISSSLVLMVLLHEITTLYARRLQSIRAQRLEREARIISGDAIAATIAHEVRQPLSAMITSADAGLRFLNRSTPDPIEAREAFKQIVADGDRARAVIESIRTNFKKDARIRTSLNVNDLITEAVDLVRDDLQIHRILIAVDANATRSDTVGDRIQLQQVLLNLITNAIDSMTLQNGPRVLRVSSDIRGDRKIVVSVSDTGEGIASEDIERVFNPLFTTKAGGMGMGLSICRSIIEAHDGELSVVPNTPAGTVFRFALRSSD